MFSRLFIRYKMASIRCSIAAIERQMIEMRYDANLKNQLYYAGRGDVDAFIRDWIDISYDKIRALDRLMVWYQIRLGRC